MGAAGDRHRAPLRARPPGVDPRRPGVRPLRLLATPPSPTRRRPSASAAQMLAGAAPDQAAVAGDPARPDAARAERPPLHRRQPARASRRPAPRRRTSPSGCCTAGAAQRVRSCRVAGQGALRRPPSRRWPAVPACSPSRPPTSRIAGAGPVPARAVPRELPDARGAARPDAAGAHTITASAGRPAHAAGPPCSPEDSHAPHHPPPRRRHRARLRRRPRRGAASRPADSISYVKDGNVWLSTPDGARQVQVTTAGGYTYASQADDGTLVALVGQRLQKLSPQRAGARRLRDAGHRPAHRRQAVLRAVRPRRVARRHPRRLRLLLPVLRLRPDLQLPGRLHPRAALRRHGPDRLRPHHELGRARLVAPDRLAAPGVDRQRHPDAERARRGPQRGRHPRRRRRRLPDDHPLVRGHVDQAACATAR